MDKIESMEDDDPDPSKRVRLSWSQERELEIFEEEMLMISQLKRMLARRKLNKEKRELLFQLMEIKRKLKILDKLDAIEETKKNMK